MTDITVTLGKPELDAEERRQRVMRAQEVLSGSGWVFDEVIGDLTRELLGTDAPAQKERREEIFQEIKATAQVKGHLTRILQQKAAEEAVNERRTRNEPPADHE